MSSVDIDGEAPGELGIGAEGIHAADEITSAR